MEESKDIEVLQESTDVQNLEDDGSLTENKETKELNNEENIEKALNEKNETFEIQEEDADADLNKDNSSNENLAENSGETVDSKKEENSEEKQDKKEEPKIQVGFSSNFDLSKLDKKSREILEDTDETDYTFKLNQFEGPLDLLVHLIKITKIDIRDIFISDITEQYMKMMEDIDSVDVEKASEFISMAATLLEIKSKHLLPTDPVDEEPDTTEEDFYRMVEEYKLIKDEMEKLAEIENVNSFYKAPDNTVGEFRYELPESLSVDALIKSFSNLMQKMAIKAEVVQEKKIQKDKFTVAQKIAQIKDTLLEKSEFKFSSLFEEEYSRSEVINTFLALLELLKRQYIKVRQNSLFEDIDIIRNDDVQERLTDENYSEYEEDNNGEDNG